MYPKLTAILTAFTLSQPVLRANVAILADYPLGEPGSLGTNSRPLDLTGTYSYTGNNYGGTTPVATAGVSAPGSTHYLDTSDTTRQEGFWGPVFSVPGSDNFAMGIYVRAAEDTAATRGSIFTSGPSNQNGVLKITLDGNGWSASAHNVAWIGTAGGTGFTANTWVHLALIRSGGVTTFYIDGAAQAGTWSGTPVFGQSHLGVDAGGTNAFDGHLDQARVVTFTAGESVANILAALTSAGAPEPHILQQPASVVVQNGGTATFTAYASGHPTPTYQWFRNPGAVPVSGGATGTLTLANVTSADTGDYYVVATNTAGSDTSATATLAIGRAPTPSTLPDAVQQMQMDRKYGMFCHFGVNTFADQEWTDGTLPATTFNPTAVDADQWVLAAKAAGMRYLLLTTKHHDGFCLWPSAYTTYDVASSSRPDLDVVKLVSDACQRHGLRFAVYYSLWDRNWNNGAMRATSLDLSPANSAAYVTYMKNQLTELLTNYGPVAELWLDGGWVTPSEDWNIPAVYDLVKSLQPECQVSVNWTVGPEGSNVTPANQQPGDPLRYFPSDFRTADPFMPKFADPKTFTHSGNTYYLPFEATITIANGSHWFYHTGDETAKPLSSLENSFNTATAQGNLLVINCSPNRNGVLLPSNVTALAQLAQRLGLEPDRPFPVNLARTATASASTEWPSGGHQAWKASDEDPNSRWAAADGDASPTLSFDFGQATTFDRIMVNEYGEGDVYRCQSFDLQTSDDGSAWTTIHSGTTLGESIRIDLPAPVTSRWLRLRVNSASGAVSIWMFKVQNSARPDPEKTSFRLWQEQNFTLGEIQSGIAGADTTPWGDGLPNFLKYALGIGNARHPHTGGSATTFGMFPGGGWKFQFHRARPDVTYTIQSSSDLQNWQLYDQDPGSVGSPVEVFVPGGTGSLFLRLQAAEKP
ncbi:alpha-L-fucosidase [Luteolibacter ambystomatis]|uniref:alpha-L-fucosidase n=1 Tax=Luteolibacter ambystomatis TaxID=2824561 RepID=A0A975PHB4_9BACT|nr:alpha-L-fucosidase [Luteolibacter ambystomatis]QUE53157.1 alpha-L-fucosidase [Luteolibacter ambystomatis]